MTFRHMAKQCMGQKRLMQQIYGLLLPNVQICTYLVYQASAGEQTLIFGDNRERGVGSFVCRSHAKFTCNAVCFTGIMNLHRCLIVSIGTHQNHDTPSTAGRQQQLNQHHRTVTAIVKLFVCGTIKVSQSFVCRGCRHQSARTALTSVDMDRVSVT